MGPTNILSLCTILPTEDAEMLTDRDLGALIRVQLGRRVDTDAGLLCNVAVYLPPLIYDDDGAERVS